VTTTTQLRLDVTADPIDRDAEHRETIRWVIAGVARRNNGHVSMNAVRPRLADLGVPGHLVGREVARLRRAGILVETGTERSTDTKSGNGGRHIPTYRFTGGAA
jgi:hypothetical protein